MCSVQVAYRITSDEEGHVVLACKHSKQGASQISSIRRRKTGDGCICVAGRQCQDLKAHSPAGVYYPEEVSAQVLLQLLRNAEDFAGAAIKRAVISVSLLHNRSSGTGQIPYVHHRAYLIGSHRELIHSPVAQVPAYFNTLQQNATIAAGRLAGLEQVKLIKWVLVSVPDISAGRGSRRLRLPLFAQGACGGSAGIWRERAG